MVLEAESRMVVFGGLLTDVIYCASLSSVVLEKFSSARKM